MTRKLTRNYPLRAVAPFYAGGPRFGSTKLAAAAIRDALTLAVLCALLLIVARPVQAQTETVLHNFTGGSDGGYPYASLTSCGAGIFYGTTPYGGLAERYNGYGVVFKLSATGSGVWEETVLYSFTGGADGGSPVGPVIFDQMGNLYGTAANGGATGQGVVFELSPAGTKWTETVLYNFAGGTDGVNPESGLIMDRAGNLYGTTLGCCGIGYGTVFELTPSSGVWTERVIYSVNTTTYAGLTMDFAGNIFGSGNDSVFLLSPDGSGGWNPTVIHTFPNRAKDGNAPEGTLVLDKAGNVYGTTSYGGAKNRGTVYRLTRRRNGKWTEQILYSFNGGTNDGSEPFAGIVLDATGNIYGTTVGGGKSGDGVVFELVAPAGKGGYKQKILWSFDGRDGQEPVDSLILNSAGKLYGTTYYGGQSDSGVVFEVTR